ncbi:MAG TPA: hypothetical protein VIR30_20550 [Nocardioides sp.]|uniref:Uncharacterized protein n=1 Tax=Nocardioides daedukensis TaxID=634462 RepID=A0A7Y9RVW7_9ACTN|nr:hypothetical protein [Nocardioides daedukensis]NYG57607.1 hypothetical protein [Nocardioides daedukensis]
MKAQLYVAQGIVAGRVHHEQDPTWLRQVQLARAEARAERRARRARL